MTLIYDVTDKESFSNVKAWMGEIGEQDSHGVNELLAETKGDLTSQEELSTGEAKELADSLKRAIRVRQVKVPRQSMSRRPCPESLVREEGG